MFLERSTLFTDFLMLLMCRPHARFQLRFCIDVLTVWLSNHTILRLTTWCSRPPKTPLILYQNATAQHIWHPSPLHISMLVPMVGVVSFSYHTDVTNVNSANNVKIACAWHMKDVYTTYVYTCFAKFGAALTDPLPLHNLVRKNARVSSAIPKSGKYMEKWKVCDQAYLIPKP